MCLSLAVSCGRTLRATSRFFSVSRALYTVPMPPLAMCWMTSYFPMRTLRRPGLPAGEEWEESEAIPTSGGRKETQGAEKRHGALYHGSFAITACSARPEGSLFPTAASRAVSFAWNLCAAGVGGVLDGDRCGAPCARPGVMARLCPESCCSPAGPRSYGNFDEC